MPPPPAIPPVPSNADADQDGCSNWEEINTTVSTGGLRDPTVFWDYFDVPTLPGPARNQVILSATLRPS